MHLNSSPSAIRNESSTPGSEPSAKTAIDRKMVCAELFGKHEHITELGHRVQISLRNGKYLARARWQRKQIGVTLGQDPKKAEHSLRRILVEMDNGTFLPPLECRRQRFPTTPAPRHDLRGLINVFVSDRQRLKGRKTARTYGNRLMHALEFSELSKSKKTWPLALTVNRQFAIEYRNFLFAREVTRNGKDGGLRKCMSPKMVQLCLEALRTVLKWGSRADVRQLPPDFVNPITDEIIGPKPAKNPLRKNPVPMRCRIEIVQEMDAWQLCNLTPSLVLPIRFEDLAGAKISDFDLDRGYWRLGARVGGNDFNKGRVIVQMPLPSELIAILQTTVGSRTDGPMFRSRADWERKNRKQPQFSTPEEFEALCETAIHKAAKDSIGTEQDRKALIRQLLKECGAVSTDAIGREVRKLYGAAGLATDARPYDLRAAVTTDMHDAGLRHLELTYLTEHSVKDILNEYTGLDPVGQMSKYFQTIAPLLMAIQQRACELGVTASTNFGLESQKEQQ